MNVSDIDWGLRSPLGPDHAGPEPTELDLMTAAHSEACVLFTGSDATVLPVARRIHGLSPWRNGPLEVVCCEWPEAVVESLVSRVFREAGPMSALESSGRLGPAGTILLQSVWRMGPAQQRRLADGLEWLRKEQRPAFRDWRLMASTSRPLFARVANGTFDDRLFYRLNVIHLVLPGATIGDFQADDRAY